MPPWMVLLFFKIATMDCEPLELKFNQHDYKMEFGRAEAVSFNRQYVKDFKVVSFKKNRTCTVCNVTIQYKIHVGNDMEVETHVYKFMSNEYRFFPIQIRLNYCSVLSNNVMGMKSQSCGNATLCPILKDRIYHFCNWVPDFNKFPPLIPDGDYMIEVKSYFWDKEMWTFRGYGKVYRPLKTG